MKRAFQSVLLLVVGCAGGCAGGVAVARMQTASAAGAWRCYVADRLPDLESAGSWGKTADVGRGLDRVAGHAASGTILTMQANPSTSWICVKY